MKVRGIRGAITVSGDHAEEICEATLLLLNTIAEENKIDTEDLASVFFSMTPDLHSAFPAKFSRNIPDWENVPLFCMQELEIEGGLPKCIRVLLHWNTDRSQKEIHHVYLRDAIKLRPDLSK
jgi:chorismate mutase